MPEDRIRVFLAPILVRESKQHVEEFKEVTMRLSKVVVSEKLDGSILDQADKDVRACGRRAMKGACRKFSLCRRYPQTVWGSTDSPNTPVATPR